MESTKKHKQYKQYKITGMSGLDKMDKLLRKPDTIEILPYANRTPLIEVASNIIPDKKAIGNNKFIAPILVTQTKHSAVMGTQNILKKVNEFLNLINKEQVLDVLSVSGKINSDGTIDVYTFVRVYGIENIPIDELYTFLGETYRKREEEVVQKTGLNIDDVIQVEYTEEQIKNHDILRSKQEEIFKKATNEKPFLNQISQYIPKELPNINANTPMKYLLSEKRRRILTKTSYETFSKIFEEALIYLTTVENNNYYNVLRGRDKESNFMNVAEEYVKRVFVFERKTLAEEDLPIMIQRLHEALFELYIIQELINDDEITDIKITDYNAIRVRIKGNAYLSDVSFVDVNDYMRFISAIIIRNQIDDRVPEQTFTDNHDPRYKLRFTITMPYIASDGIPILHIRKISRKKLLADDLIKAGMFDEKIRDYLIDCGKNSNGVIFAGPPGSGKTVALNWFLEDAYEDSAEILVIQENDELFSYRKGIMFQHVVLNPVHGQQRCTLEDLGQLALVAGANVFVIGEVKGAEICSAITLSNSGCRTALTVHSRSSTEAIDKMTDLAMRGNNASYEQNKRMMKSFQTIVFLNQFKVEEISEVIGFDENTKEIIYRPIYRRNADALCN